MKQDVNVKKINKMEFIPRGKDVLAELILVETKTEMKGMTLLESTREKGLEIEMFINHPYQAKIVRIGSEQKEYKIGDIIIYQFEQRHPIRLNNKTYSIFQDHAVKGKIYSTDKKITVDIT